MDPKGSSVSRGFLSAGIQISREDTNLEGPMLTAAGAKISEEGLAIAQAIRRRRPTTAALFRAQDRSYWINGE